jgi:hypothetical protein
LTETIGIFELRGRPQHAAAACRELEEAFPFFSQGI